jgi:hypothetical protein
MTVLAAEQDKIEKWDACRQAGGYVSKENKE